MENEIPENINQVQSTSNDPSIAEQFLDSIADNALYHAFDSAVDKIVDVTKPAVDAIADIAGTTVKKVAENAGDVVDKIDVSDAAGDAVGDAAGGILGEVLGGIIDNIL
jgi:hypothetical protein